MEDRLKETAEEFLDSATDNIKKRRFNAAVSDSFKAIAIFCDYLIYREEYADELKRITSD